MLKLYFLETTFLNRHIYQEKIELADEHLIQIMIAANKYDLKELFENAAFRILNTLNETNFVERLNLIFQMDNENFNNRVMRYLAKMTPWNS